MHPFGRFISGLRGHRSAEPAQRGALAEPSRPRTPHPNSARQRCGNITSKCDRCSLFSFGLGPLPGLWGRSTRVPCDSCDFEDSAGRPQLQVNAISAIVNKPESDSTRRLVLGGISRKLPLKFPMKRSIRKRRKVDPRRSTIRFLPGPGATLAHTVGGSTSPQNSLSLTPRFYFRNFYFQRTALLLASKHTDTLGTRVDG